jgi:beta-glucosidase
VRDVEASVPVPIRQLQGFTRIHLKPGTKQIVSFTLTPRQMSCFTDGGIPMVEPGLFEVSVGGGQPGASVPVVLGSFRVVSEE